MPIYRDKGYPDCFIECYSSGSAIYIAPDGPCLRECGEDSLSKTLEMVIQKHGYHFSFSVRFRMSLYDIEFLVRMIDDRKDVPRSVERSASLLKSLQEEILSLKLSPSIERYDSYLSNTTVATFLIHLALTINKRLERLR